MGDETAWDSSKRGTDLRPVNLLTRATSPLSHSIRMNNVNTAPSKTPHVSSFGLVCICMHCLRDVMSAVARICLLHAADSGPFHRSPFLRERPGWQDCRPQSRRTLLDPRQRPSSTVSSILLIPLEPASCSDLRFVELLVRPRPLEMSMAPAQHSWMTVTALHRPRPSKLLQHRWRSLCGAQCTHLNLDVRCSRKIRAYDRGTHGRSC